VITSEQTLETQQNTLSAKASKAGVCEVRSVVDSSPATRKSLRRLFAQEGWKVCGEAWNGREMISKALEFKPDVVILDLSVPEMNGFTIASILKKLVPDSHRILFRSFADLTQNDNKLWLSMFSAIVPKQLAGNQISKARSLVAEAQASACRGLKMGPVRRK
jgi:chemotaxis response regulator CheB